MSWNRIPQGRGEVKRLESITVTRVYRDRWPWWVTPHPEHHKDWLWLEVLHMPTYLRIAVMSNTRVALGFSDIMRMLARAVLLARGGEVKR